MTELRERQLDLFARIKFTPEKEPIQESRSRLEGLYQIVVDESKLDKMVERSASQLSAAANYDFIEVEGI